MIPNKRILWELIFPLVFVLNFSFAAPAQKAKPTPKKKVTPVYTVVDAGLNEAVLQSKKLNSKLMAREIPYNVYLPRTYDWDEFRENRYAVIYLLHGLTGHYDNWAAKTKLSRYAADAKVIIVMPEGGDGWYTDSALENNDRYESYIVQELIPEIDKKFRTFADKDHRAIAGFSMGGFGALKFGVKHPKLFAVAGSFSGVLGAARATEKEIGKGDALRSIQKVFGADDSAARSANDLFQMTRDLESTSVKELPFIYFDCGTEDRYFQYNLDYAKLLREKKIPHEFREIPGGHSWKCWDAQVQEFLRLTDKVFK